MSALAPAVRLLGLLLLVSGLFAARLPLIALILALGLVTLFIEGMRPRALGPELLPLLFLVLSMTAIDTLSFETGLRFLPEGIPQALLDSGRLLASFVLARLFYQATPSSELREAAEWAGAILPGNLGQDAALALSLILGFIPSILREWRLSLEAARARGLGRHSGLGPSLSHIAAFLGRVLGGALVLPEVLLARGWTGLRRKTRVWRSRDYLALGLAAGVTALAFLGIM